MALPGRAKKNLPPCCAPQVFMAKAASFRQSANALAGRFVFIDNRLP
ncbi:hypothetical protein [Roseibium aquae]|nr:hypothetical protein [Roseibium aquae]